MATDEELLIVTTLEDNWDTDNSPLPKFYYDDTIKNHVFRVNNAIKIYLNNSIPTPKGLGYDSQRKEATITLDLRSKIRDRFLTDRDEIKRIIELKRKTLTGWDICKITNENKAASYFNYYQNIFTIRLIKYISNI